MPEGDSSSPRDDVVIDSIESRGAGREKIRIRLSDGSSFLLLREILELAGLTESDTLSWQRLQDLLDQSDQLEAERKALDLITRSPHSRERLKLKLLKKDFSHPSIERALDRMEELGYLDDARFAEEWLQSRIARHPEGRRSLLGGLLHRGIDSSIAGELVNRIVTREVEEDCVKRLMKKHAVLRSLPREKLAQRLASRGFSSVVIRKLLEEARGDD